MIILKKLIFFSILLLVLAVLTTLASQASSNQAISIRVETSGTESKLVKTILQDLCLTNGYTVVDRENTGAIYYEQDLKNNPRYNDGTAVNSGNMIIATVILKVDTTVESQYYYDIGGYVGGGYGNVDNTNYQTTMKYSLSLVELGTYSDVKTVTGSANETDIYGRYKWIGGRYGEYSNAVRTASIYDAAQNIIPDISAIATNVLTNYYSQTSGGSYQPYPDPVPPQSTYNNTGGTTATQNYTTVNPNNPAPATNSNQIAFDNLKHLDTYPAVTQIIIDPNVDIVVSQFVTSCSANELYRISNNTIIYSNGSSNSFDNSQPFALSFADQGQPGQLLTFAINDGRYRKVIYIQY